MANKFDAYRDALVVETKTIWSEEFDDLDDQQRSRIETALHAAPRECENLEYLRRFTGFCRQISVTSSDLDRLRTESTAKSNS